MLAQLDTFVGPEINWFALSPMLTLLVGALALMLLAALTPQWPRGAYATFSAVTAGTAGALAMVPGSNRLARNPRPDEIMLGGESGNPNAVPIDLQPGDCAVWHGSTWHGSFIRQVPGIRINLAMYFCRQYIVTQEKYGEHVPQEVLDRHSNDPRFLTLLGQRQPYGWGAEGPDNDKVVQMPRGQFD